MRVRVLLLNLLDWVAALFLLCCFLLWTAFPLHAQRTNTFYVDQFQGPDVGAKVKKAQAACSPAMSCVLIFDPSLAVFAAGSMPSQGVNEIWIDYRNGFSATPFSPAPTAQTIVNAGDFTDSATHFYNTTKINNCDPAAEYNVSDGSGGTYHATEAVTGCIAAPSTAVTMSNSALSGYATTARGTYSVDGRGSAIGVRAQARGLANDTGVFGANIIAEDDGNRTANISLHGAEIDVGVQSPLSAYREIYGLNAVIQGNGAGECTSSNCWAYVASSRGSGHHTWAVGFQAADGDVLSSLSAGALCSSDPPGQTCDSQTIQFVSRSAGNRQFATIDLSASGSIRLNPTGTAGSGGAGVNINGGLRLVPASQPSGGAGYVACGSNSGDLRCSYNNDTAKHVTRTIASGTATMTTAAIASGQCGSAVTVAASGVTTSDVISLALSAGPGLPNGILTLNRWVTSDNVNFQWCNPTATSQTPTAATVNFAVIR